MTDDLFPASGISPATTADVIAQYEFVLGNLSVSGFASGLLAAHERALATDNHPLAVMLRSDALADLREAAGRYGHPGHELETMEAARRRVGDAAVAKFKLGVCEQIAATKGHPLATAAKKYIAAARAAEQAAIEAAEQAAREQAEREAAAAAERAAKKAEAERAAAELKRAAAEASSVESQLRAVQEQHRQLRVRRIRAELEQLIASGVTAIRARTWMGLGRYACQDVIDVLDLASTSELDAYEAAVVAELERREAREARKAREAP